MSPQSTNDKIPLTILNQWLLIVISFFLEAFGQPAWLSFNGLISSVVGFALFWRLLLAYPSPKHRFCLGTLWFFAVQLVQLSWFISHPFWYIYSVYLLLAVIMGLQFGVIALFICPDLFTKKSLIKSSLGFLSIAGLWTLFEWSRLFMLSGSSWNPIGIAMTSYIYPLQAASIAGIFGLSFWVILVNLLGLRAFIQKRAVPVIVWFCAAGLPYLYGFAQISIQEKTDVQSSITAMLVQTAFSPEEIREHSTKKSSLQHVIEEWKTILAITKKHQGKLIDLIVLPEFVVPYGTYSDVYPLIEVKKTFFEVLGIDSLSALPSLEYPFFSLQYSPKGPQIFVNNAYWVQGLANYFKADVVIGLEDAEDILKGEREYYSSAIFIHPQEPETNKTFHAKRYAKRVLVPMGEYIPFEYCRELARQYGVFGSFTCGKEAAVMNSNGILFSPSICYEETYGNIMREGKIKGADLFVNLTSDVWFPNSKLPKQHLSHARLRTVENGIPLIRSCNTGITAAIDSFGRDIEVLGGEYPEKVEWIPDSIVVNVPIHTYQTLYSNYGDVLIVSLSLFFVIASFACRKFML